MAFGLEKKRKVKREKEKEEDEKNKMQDPKGQKRTTLSMNEVALFCTHETHTQDIYICF